MKTVDEQRDWYVYVVECDDGSLYTGITTDVGRRIREHNESSAGAAYTRSRRPVSLRAAWACADRSEAASAEAAFKSFTRDEKLRRLGLGTTPERMEAIREAYGRTFAVGECERGEFRSIDLTDDEMVEAADRMNEGIEVARDRCLDEGIEGAADLPEPIFFVGPGRFDGHALELDGEPTVFFDMRLVAGHQNEEGFAEEVHTAHEWMHAVHYARQPAFYPGCEKSPTEEIWHRLVAEGLAIYGSEQLMDCDRRASTWFGLVDREVFEAWRETAGERREAVGEAMREVTESVRFGDTLWADLFRGGSDPTGSRLGYWYGREIVRRAASEAGGVVPLFDWPPEAWRSRVERWIERAGKG